MTTDETTEVKTITHTRTMPRREADLLTVATSAVVAWRKDEGLTLKWTNVDMLDATVDAFRGSYRTGAVGKGERRSITQNLAEVNTEINNSLRYVKGYIAEKFGAAQAAAHYEQFGIAKVKAGYMLPLDGDRRQEALEQLLYSLRQHGMTTQKYGAPYWNEIYIRFGQAREEAAAVDSLISQQVGYKSNQTENIRYTLNALILLIKANFPQTWKEEMRRWGFQKEKY